MPDDQLAPRRIVVLHIITRMVKGGAQEVLLDLVTRLDQSKFECILATGPSEGPEGSLVDKATCQGADLRTVPSLVREISPLKDLYALREITRLIRQIKPDIVHTHTSKAGVLGRVAAHIARVRVTIHSPHGHVFYGYYGKLKTGLFVALERWCSRYANRLVMITENELTDHVELRIAPRDKFIVISSGVDLDTLISSPAIRSELREQLNIGADAPVVGTMGRLVPIKGQIHLIDAMPGVLARFPDAHLVLIGSGPLHETLQNRAAQLGIGGNVHFAGYRTDIAVCLKALDLFALPSLNEGMGRVLVEAMALRLPVVASNVCGIRDLIFPGQNGILVPAANSAALSEAICEIFGDPDGARRMGEKGFSIAVPNYGLETMLTKTERLYTAEIARASSEKR